MAVDRTDGTDIAIFGAVLLDQREQLVNIAGPQRYEAALRRLEPSQRAEYDGLGFFTWCHHATATAVTVAVATEIGWDPAQLQETVVRQGIEKTFSTIWRKLLSYPSEAALLRRAAFIYSKAIRGGAMEARLTDKRLSLVLRGWPDLPHLDRIALCTGIETLLRLSGRPAARLDPHRRGDDWVFDIRDDQPIRLEP